MIGRWSLYASWTSFDETSSGHGLEAIEAQSSSVASQIVKKVTRLLPNDDLR